MKRTLRIMLSLALAVAMTLPSNVAFGQGSTPYTSASLFIWTDKYVYQPGDPITVRWKARANGDATPCLNSAVRPRFADNDIATCSGFSSMETQSLSL